MSKISALLISASVAFGFNAAPAFADHIVTTPGYHGACPVGTHDGYEGKYCWSNGGGSGYRACPRGTHVGYEGKYCWRNRY